MPAPPPQFSLSRYLWLCVCLLLGISGCKPPSSPDSVTDEGVLRIVTRYGATTYYENHQGETGFEYELAKRFADHLGVRLEVEVTHSYDKIFDALDQGRAHIAAAGLALTPERQQTMLFSPSYLQVRHYVLYRFGDQKPNSIADLVDKNVVVMANSSQAEVLRKLSVKEPQLQWREAADAETIDLLDMLANGDIDYTVVYSNEYLANRALYPKLKRAFDIGEPSQLAWAISRATDHQSLARKINAFFNKIEQDGTLAQLQERFYSHIKQIDAIGTMTFLDALNSKYPTYQAMIEQIAQENSMEWQLLAAISYQESHWNPQAKSPTGVRGMMMLTQPTAKEMGVSNRLDAEQSLRGGARYFNKILRRIPAHIPYPDRAWFTLASYNVGYGHLEDARILTEKAGGDPNKWADVKEQLPLLRKRRWYQQTKHGFARGNEAVTYVQNIRHFYNILTWSELALQRTPPPQNAEQYVPDNLKGDLNSL